MKIKMIQTLSAIVLLMCGIAFSVHAEPSANKKFVVGLILPLSGGLADFGEALRRGFELAQQDAPELFSHIELRYQDSQFDQKVALSAFNALEQQGGVNLYHVWGVSPNETVLPAANARSRPVIAETSMRSAPVNKPYVVRASRTGYDAAEKLIKVFSERKWTHVGVIVTQIPYYTDIVDALKEIGSKYGIKVEVVGEVTPTDQDFRSLLLKSKDKKFDAFGPLVFLDQLFAFCEQAKVIHFSPTIFGAHIHNSVDAMTRCSPLSEGALFPGQIIGKEFRERYIAKYKTDQRLDSAAQSYETAKIIGELFGKAESYKYTAQQILDSLKTVNHTATPVGSYHYAETPEGGKAISFDEIILTFKDGQIVPLAK